MTKKVDLLFQLGPASRHRDWPDYLQYGFDESDVPDLLELVGNDSLNKASTQSDDVWVPLHAWRTLGQLRTPIAVAPLIALFDGLHQDDWALSELSRVMGMIGEPAIDMLATYLNQGNHPEFARAMALDGLAEVAKHHPLCRERIIAAYQEYLVNPDTSMTTLNGLLMGRLMDLKAVELIEDIRGLFKTGAVDIACSGDLEEVEFELGLRSRRTTPEPDLAQLYGLPTPPESNRQTAIGRNVRTTRKVGRNDPCPCGSGKKYKRCCLH